MSENVKELTTENFDAQTAKGLCLVDFWAPWCGPCRTQGPIVDQLADQVEGKVLVAKVNVDEAAAVAARFGVRSIPTLVILKDGESVDQMIGLRKADDLTAALKRHGADL